ncbi:hypothetical protein [Mycobacterium asiaticum]|uniref:Cysteine dioxygenase n=1 Tax=Mycobacterium asiaticum TaxID=1790 RepID=A0A1A3NQE8_MYCAS|nr:hypothetical protein [Mycobacterium asiaticum]OBK22527.1 hypothetical protein A5635_21665 [Mycobacterium asiaticum]
MSATSYRPSNRAWLSRLLSRQPHQTIGEDPNDPYLLRWYVIPRNRFINVYLHKFMRDDADTLHDHPWWFVSLILRGGYIEHTESPDRKMVLRCRTSIFDVRSPWWRRCIAFRPATWRHQVVLPHTPDGGRVPCWTLIITGRNTRTWGFWCPTYSGLYTNRRRVGERFVPWQQFTSGAGCGEVA